MTPTHSLVTGASGGIGLEIARILAGEGRNLLLVARDSAKLAALASELRSRGVDVQVIIADLGTPHAADEVFAEAGRRRIVVDVLVNNAGFGLYGKHADTALEEEQQMVDVNVTALTRLTKLVLPGMIVRASGQIMNMASTAAFQPGPYMAVYYATKAYVLSYSEALNEELRGSGVSVTALCPGPTASGFQVRARMQASGLVKGKRLPTAREVATYAVESMHRRRAVAIPGLLNWLMAQSIRFTPRNLTTRIVAQMSRPA